MKRSPVPYTLPKADMHVHISLALDIFTFMRRIKDQRTNLDPDFLLDRDPRYYPNLTKFHNTYESMREVTKSPQELADVTQSYLELIEKEGAIYAELSNSFRDGNDFDMQMEAVSEGIEAARESCGIEARIVVTTLRNHGAEQAEKAANHLTKNTNPLITGFGLVGDEGVNRMSDFQGALNIAWHEAGLGLTPHVAEQHPHNAVDFLNAVPEDCFHINETDHRRLRVGHGTLIYLSDYLLKQFADRQICMEVCPSANKRIGLPDETAALNVGDTLGSDIAVDHALRNYYDDIANHPLKTFIDKNIPICLGSDNPMLMNTNIGKEHAMASKAGASQMSDQLNFTRNALKFANVDPETRLRLMHHVDVYQQAVDLDQSPERTALGYRRAADRL